MIEMKAIEAGCLAQPDGDRNGPSRKRGTVQYPIRPLGRDDRVALLGARCSACATLMFPRRLRCVNCFGAEMEAADLVGPGRVLSFTTVRQPPPGYEGPTPYVLGQVEIHGVTVLAHLTGREPEEWKVGDVVVPCSVLLGQGDGDTSLSYGFRLERSSDAVARGRS